MMIQTQQTISSMITSAALALVISLPAFAQSDAGITSKNVQFTSDRNSSQVQVDGDSTTTEWTVKGNVLKGHIQFDKAPSEALAKNNELTFDVSEAGIEVPVKSIEGSSDGLTDHMYKSMEAEKYKTISYELNDVKFRKRIDQSTIQVQTQGQLTIHGETNEQKLKMNVSKDGGRLEVSGDVKLLMTDFGIKPPTAMGGMIEADDEVTVSWTWATVPQYKPRYEAGSLMLDTMKTLIKRYDRARSALANGKNDEVQSPLKQIKRVMNRIDLSITDIDKEAHPKIQKLLDNLNNALKKAIQGGSLDSMRQQFMKISSHFWSLIRAIGHGREKPVRYYSHSGNQNKQCWIGMTESAASPYTSSKEKEDQGKLRAILKSGE